MKKLGIIGGLGPMATVYFMELIIKMTDVKKDQDHISISLRSIPDTPDRTEYICGISKESPLPKLLEAGQSLEKDGVDFIAIPCVTAQYFYQTLSSKIQVPILSLVQGLALEIKEKGIKKVGLMATDGTIKSAVLQSELSEYGIDVVLPSTEKQKDIMDLIYTQIKAGKSVDLEQFYQVGDELKFKGAERIIMGCTELSLIKRLYENEIDSIYVDVLDTLAKQVVIHSGAPLKKEYQNIV